MRCRTSFQWSVWISIFLIGLLQAYTIFSSLSRYIHLKSEVFSGHKKDIERYKWVIYLLDLHILTIISALGALPLWLYSVMFSLSSISCQESSPPFHRQGFHELIWKEAVDILNHQMTDMSNIQNHNKSPNCHCQRKIKFSSFHPIASFFQVLIAYLLLMPIPFMDAWLLQTEHKNQEELSMNDIDFLVSNTLSTKIKWSVEYFNFLISLTVFALQFPSLIWTTNKLFSVAFSLLEFLIVVHVLIDYPIVSVAIKSFFKKCSTCLESSNGTFAFSGLLLTASMLGNAFLLLTFISIFQFAFEKCVQTLLKSVSFCNSFRQETIGLSNNIDQFPGQINTSNSVLCSNDRIVDVGTGCSSFISAALFFFVGASAKVGIYYQYQYFNNASKLFTIFLIQSLVLVITYFMFWFGISLKPKWAFIVKDIERRRPSHNPMIPKEECNYYKSLNTNLKNSQISLSTVSNTNLSLHSVPNQMSFNKIDFTSPEPYFNKCSSLKLPIRNRDNQDIPDYFLLSQHLPPPKVYKTLNSNVTSPKLFTEDRRENKLQLNNYYKCTSTYSCKKPMDKLRLEDPYQMYRKQNSIQEETSHENLSSISDDVSSNVTSSPNTELANKNHTNLKFVTFRLDNNAEISADITSSSSNGSLTVISLEQSEAFLRELDGDTSDKPIPTRLTKDSDYSSDTNNTHSASFSTIINHTKISLL